MSRTLIIAPNWVGDLLMAQPLFARLRNDDPGLSLSILAPSWVAPLARAMPEVNAVIETSFVHGSLQWRARREQARTIRALNFDRAIVLPNSAKSALIPWLAGIPSRIGYRGEMRSVFLTHVVPGPDLSRPMASRYAALADQFGQINDDLKAPKLAVAPSRAYASARKFGLDPSRPFIAICPGAEYGPAKQWPARHIAELIQLLRLSRPHTDIALIGGPGDQAIARAILILGGSAGTAIDLTGRTSLAEAIDLLSIAGAVLSNDSGLMHVAAALDRPQVAIYGSSDPRHTPALSSIARMLWLHLECSPCFERQCPLGHMRCLNDILPARVATELQACLAA